MGIHRIPVGKIGVAIRLFGTRKEGEFSPHVSVLGSPGPQATVLKSNQTYVFSPGRTRVEYHDQVHVKRGTIGLVVAREGKPRQEALAPFVECDHFQDGEAFLVRGGQRGVQMQVLPEGDYDINPYLFDVITTGNVGRHGDLGLRESDLYATRINAGETGVVITHAGGPKTTDSGTPSPRVPGHHHFRDPWQFLGNGGQLGVQQETLPSGGHYVINPVFAHVIRVPTREIILEWTKDPKGESNYDASLEQVTLDVEGYTVRLELTQTLQIPQRAAPGLVLRYGDQSQSGFHPVQQFVEKVLASTVTSYFQKISAHETIIDFITKYDEIGSALTQELDDAISSFGAIPVRTQLGTYDVTPDIINELRQDIASKKHELKLRTADAQVRRAQNEIDKERLEVEAERRKLDLILTQGEVGIFGEEAVYYLRLLEKMTSMPVPHIVAGGDIAEVMRALPFGQFSQFGQFGELFTKLTRRAPPSLEADEDQPDSENRLPGPAVRVEPKDRMSDMRDMTEPVVPVRHNVEQGQLVMPFYLVCDVSSSMAGAMPALNDGVRRLRRAIVAEPVVDDLAQVCIMTFSTSARVVMPMGQLSEQEVPELCAGGGTYYGEAFRALAQAILSDTARLKAEGYKVYRPCVFFLTDGAPSDAEWSRTFTGTLTYDRQTGTGMKGHPIFVPFGFGEAQEDVLRQLAYPRDRGKWYQAKTHDIGQALNGILDLIMNTMITSTRSAESGKPDILLGAVQDGVIEQGDSGYDPNYV